jgi:hypothetical protein
MAAWKFRWFAATTGVPLPLLQVPIPPTKRVDTRYERPPSSKGCPAIGPRPRRTGGASDPRVDSHPQRQPTLRAIRTNPAPAIEDLYWPLFWTRKTKLDRSWRSWKDCCARMETKSWLRATFREGLCIATARYSNHRVRKNWVADVEYRV